MTNSKRLIFLSLVLSAMAAVGSVYAIMTAESWFDGGAKKAPNFDEQVRAYLLDNPDVLIESLQRLEEERQVAEADEILATLDKNRDEIFNSPSSPAIGNLTGDITIVEFFDYNCPYCRKAAPILEEAAAADPGLRLVFKEWPILSPGSRFAARAALASQAQEKYEAFHKAMMADSASIDEAATLDIARTVGIDVEQLKLDMEDPEVQAELDRNFALANSLMISGTPSFVIGDEIVRGLVDLATLQQVIAQERGSADEAATGGRGE